MGDLGTRITLVSDHTDRIGQHRAGWNTPPFSGKPRIDAIECRYAAAGMHHADDLSIRQFLVHEIHILRPDIIEPGPDALPIRNRSTGTLVKMSSGVAGIDDFPAQGNCRSG